nr:hypothetical protein D5086_0000195000 [Ipomoea trifida]
MAERRGAYRRVVPLPLSLEKETTPRAGEGEPTVANCCYVGGGRRGPLLVVTSTREKDRGRRLLLRSASCYDVRVEDDRRGKCCCIASPHAATKLLLGCHQLRYGRRTGLPCSASPMLGLPGDAVWGNQVSNINTFIKVTLDIEKGQYITWSKLFKIHAKAYKVLDHIIPPSKEKAKSNSSLSLKDTDPELWSRVDAIVLQWIYGTISDDLLNTILERDSTAELAWNRLEDIFSDNKNSRALYLEQEFSAVRMEQFTDASSYCQHLKTLADQLSNVGAPVSNNRLVLQLVSGLTDAYATVGSQIRHEDPLPLFYKARSMIILEETAMAKKIASPYDTALHATADEQIAKNFWKNQGGRGGRTSGFNSRGGSSIRSGGYGNSSSRGGGSGNSFSRGGHSINRGSGRGGRQSSHGRGRGNRGGRQQQSQPHNPFWQNSNSYQQNWASPPMWNGPWQPWATPPYPYPTTPAQRQRNQAQAPSQSILGPKPSQAHLAATNLGQSSYAPTDIQQAMHTLSIAPPDEQWYMDTGATSHMTSNGAGEGEDGEFRLDRVVHLQGFAEMRTSADADIEHLRNRAN